ncbi:hypothetical protein [Yinghuangia sp. YIM S09857]|uniref:hypothetical protein n=1 Tax=Yinghuangia sp. YIM S09857 TaxID=3436929 RepID=UPI003F5338E9
MRRSVKRALATAGATMAIVTGSVVTGSSAHAAGYSVYYAETAPGGYLLPQGHAYFNSYGDKFELTDSVGDGDGVVVRIDLKYQGVYYRLTNAYSGAGSRTTKVFDYDFPEGNALRFSVCAQNGPSGARYNCGSWTYATA